MRFVLLMFVFVLFFELNGQVYSNNSNLGCFYEIERNVNRLENLMVKIHSESTDSTQNMNRFIGIVVEKNTLIDKISMLFFSFLKKQEFYAGRKSSDELTKIAEILSLLEKIKNEVNLRDLKDLKNEINSLKDFAIPVQSYRKYS